MNDVKLLPCPHCGGQAEYISLAICHGYVACVGDCRITTGDYWDNMVNREMKESWKEKAASAWNRRC